MSDCTVEGRCVLRTILSRRPHVGDAYGGRGLATSAITATGYLRALAAGATCSARLTAVWLLTAAVVQGAISDIATVVSASVTGLATHLLGVARIPVPGDFRHQLEFARLVLRPRAAA
jgi:hypothetical protein